MFHPFIGRSIHALLTVSGIIFAGLMVLTVAGIMLIELNGGVA